MPAYRYIGSRGETIVGMQPEDLTAEQYDALDYDHQQAVLINKGSDGGALYQEVHEDAPAAALEESPASAEIPDASAPSVEPDLNQPLDQTPAEGAN